MLSAAPLADLVLDPGQHGCHAAQPRKLATGKTTMEALRCLKRRLSDVVYQQTRADAKRLATGPGGQTGAALQSSAADPIPTASTSDQLLPGPATSKPRTLSLTVS